MVWGQHAFTVILMAKVSEPISGIDWAGLTPGSPSPEQELEPVTLIKIRSICLA